MRHMIRLASAVSLLAAATAFTTRSAGAQAALDDGAVVGILNAANTWDMESGQLAAARGTTKTIRDYGKMLVRDHQNVRRQTRDIASSEHLKTTPPAKDFAMAKEHAAAMAKLRTLNGKAFDHAFLQHEVKFHRDVIDAVNNTLLPATKSARLKKLQQTVGPALVAHMEVAQNMLDKGA
jgi:putative membrane protein